MVYTQEAFKNPGVQATSWNNKIRIPGDGTQPVAFVFF